ncbi:MAG: acylphosphatase [Candidatus Thorarchaeota archaeon]
MDSISHSCHLYITGIVQGVFFRRFVYSEAKKLGITGWVRNLYDGRVEALIFHKEQNVLRELVVKCKKGPMYAEVTDIEEIWDKDLDKNYSFKDFFIEGTV